MLPVINLNALNSGEELLKFDDENVNIASVQLADAIIEPLLSGNENVLEFAVKRRLIVDALNIVMKHEEVKSAMFDEIAKYGKQGCSAMGAKISIFSKPNYQYDKDAGWVKIKEELKPIEEKLKAQQLRIQACIKNGYSLTDETTGELIATAVPAPRTESVAVSFSKR